MTIKEIRQKYNLTQRQLSDITGIPKRTIENWDAGERKPPEYMARLIEAYIIEAYIKENTGE